MRKLYDHTIVKKEDLLFSNHDLLILLFPIVLEQLLNSFMGMADTMMVSNVGSAAISAISLVDSVNNLVIQIFAALTTGAAIICSQYIGRNDRKGANRAAGQVFLAILAISVGVMIPCLIFRVPLLSFIFGKVTSEVMANSQIYFLITVLSYPFLALFDVGSAFFRAGGNSRFPMAVSVVSNLLNIMGNAILIFGFQMGVAGAALSTLLSRVFSMCVVFYALRRDRQQIVLRGYFSIRPDMPLIKKILAIGVPSGVENGMFQFGKLAIQSTVSAMGTVAIAAQAMTNILEMLNGIAGIGIGIGLMTVVGQCIGAGRKEEAKYYIVKLTAIAEAAIIISCLFVFAITKPVVWIAHMETASADMCFRMVIAITIVKPIVWVLSFIPAYGMRAAGDVKFSMILSMLTMWCMRVALCIYLSRVWGFGPMAVWIGMFADWTLRGIIFTWRFLSGKWLQKKVI